MSEKAKVTSTNPIIQKCLDILYSGRAVVERDRVCDGSYIFWVYVDDEKCFTVTDSGVTIGREKFGINEHIGGLDFSDVSFLYAKCLETIPTDEKRSESALNSLDEANKVISAPAPVSFRDKFRAFFARGRAR